MSVKIYHGPPGSRKSGSAIRDELVRAAEEGRHVITNVRGVSEERTREVFAKVWLPRFTFLPWFIQVPFGYLLPWLFCRRIKIKDGFRVTAFNQSDKAEMDRLRRWWTWCPPSVYLLLDEVQRLYPPEAPASFVQQFNDLPREYDTDNLPAFWSESERELYLSLPPESREWRPESLAVAFDMHRHFNLDFCFTTTTIKKVRAEIRGGCEWAYKHKNLAGLGFGGLYVQSMHMAEDNGNQSDIHGQHWRRLPAWVYKVYDSTSTGKAQETQAGRSLFSDPKILILCGLIAVFAYNGVGKHGFHLFPVDAAHPPAVAANASPAPGPVPAGPQGVQRDSAAAVDGPVSSRWRIVGVYYGRGVGYAYLSDWKTDRRIGLEHCKMDRSEGWSCSYLGGVITQYSGTPPPEPKVDRPAAASAQG